MFSSRSDEWIVARWRQPNVTQMSLDDPEEEQTVPPLWKDLTVASGVALALWAIAAVLFLG